MHRATEPYEAPSQLLHACGCPRRENQPFIAPLCNVVVDCPDSEGPILVNMPPELDCKFARRFTYGEFCADSMRIRLYRDFAY